MGACAHIDPLPSLSFGSTAASIPQSVNEVSVDPLRGTTPPPWSRIATLTRLPHRTSRALPPARGQQRPQGALQAEFEGIP